MAAWYACLCAVGLLMSLVWFVAACCFMDEGVDARLWFALAASAVFALLSLAVK